MARAMAGLIGDAFASVLAAFNSVSWFNVNQSLVFAKWCRDTAGQLVEHAAGARGYTSGEEAEGQGPRAECVCGRKLPPPEGSAQARPPRHAPPPPQPAGPHRMTKHSFVLLRSGPVRHCGGPDCQA